MHVSEVETPALIVDLDRLERNIARAAAYADAHSLRMVPHTKTHKTPEIGRLQLAAGAAGLTVAKTTEAEAMLAAEPPFLLVAYPVLGEAKLRRLMTVARRTRVAVSLDSREAAEQLSAAASAASVSVGVRVEAEMGMMRCGLPVGDGLFDLARLVDRLPGLELEGAQFYPGQLWPLDADIDGQLAAISASVAAIRAGFDRAGLPLRVVSGGTSPTLWRSHEVAGMNEIRPGTYVFNDRTQVASGGFGWDDCAATVLVTVVSTPRPGFALVDGGSKSFSSDMAAHAPEGGHGRVVEAPGCRLIKLNEEHGHLDTSQSERPIRIGDRLRVIPNHVCVAVNLHEKIVAVRGEEVEQVWTVAGRGKLQ
jgi:D-serine deaminase-like pyridoxal phosphate-dependent protein